MFFLLIREATIICSQYLVSVTLNYAIRAFNVCRLKKESCYQHVSLLACYLISNPIVSCLNHFNNIISACFPKYTLFWDKKRTAIVLLSFRRRYFTMGIVKIYNVLGVFTLIIVSRVMKNVYYRDAQTCINSRLFFMQYVYD